MERVLSDTELNKLNRYFNALNYLTVGQLYLLDNPLLKRPLKKDDIKKKIVGHWGTCPSQNFIFTHCNRVIKNNDLNMMMVVGPGHGGNAFVSNVYLEGTYSEVYPNITQDEEGMKKLFKQFSFPGGISSHVAPETPGSINEGGELGYSLAHAFGAVFDNPSLICTCIVGDGEAETGTLATSWHSNKFLNPITDGAVLPILHLNGYKIANPTILARISDEELTKLFEGYGWKPYFVSGDEPLVMHELMASTMDKCIKDIKTIQEKARKENNPTRPVWPMIVLRTPKGWTGPVEVDGKIIENTFRAHQVPIMMDKDEHLEILESWMRSYKPQELFDENGRLLPELKELLPTGDRRMGANPHTNGGKLLRDLRTPDFKDYALDIKKPGQLEASDMTELGKYIKGVLDANKDNKNFRVFGPDETMSNRLGSVFETNNRTWNASFVPNDEFLAMDGRIMDSMLSENMCQGWLEGYLLTGRHGFFASYEAFIRVVDSMASQHAKWLKISKALSWKAPIASLNYILSSNVWQQDHNGYTHQDPGFLDHIANKKADIVRIYLPPDANCLLSCFDHCIKSKNYINVLVTSKHLRPQWLTMDQAIKHCTKGIGIWDFVSNDYGDEPDVVIACAGETPTLECVAAVSILRKYVPEIKIRFINVVDLMKLQPKTRHPHGLSDDEFDMLFTRNKPIIFAFHGYPTLIHEFMYERHNKNLLVCGYNEEGSITTPFDMRVQNEIDRYHLVINVVKKLPSLGTKIAYITQEMNDKLIEHKEYITTYGIDMPEVRDYKWQ